VILYRTRDSRTGDGWVVEHEGRVHAMDVASPDQMLADGDLHVRAEQALRGATLPAIDEKNLLAPVGSQEVWAAGVTYYRSREARMEESKQAGGGSFYDRVYAAERPELFFKAQAQKVVGHGGAVAIRSDAKWTVPEPELVLVIDARGKIVGYTVGNDMSSRDIEGENPLYLPQAKIYDGSCAMGPGILVRNEPLPPETRITVGITRGGVEQFAGETTLQQMKRRPDELVAWLYRDQTFAAGSFLFTGTGIVPPESFTLERGDTVRIGIDGIGVLMNPVG
jgi:2-dehydro-3-deoxy-D-arabinonate dehydratase